MTEKIKIDTIEEALEEIRNGKVVIVVDDEDRENEGDFICAAEAITPEIVNFMATHGRGLICAPLAEDRCEELKLDLMVGKNTAVFETPFTVSVDLIGHGCATGISAHDRFKTIKALVDPETKPEELGKPGHIFPLKAKKEGVLRRSGHTEAAIDLAKLAGFRPAGVLVEIMNENGTMARLPDLIAFASRPFQIKIDHHQRFDRLPDENRKSDQTTHRCELAYRITETLSWWPTRRESHAREIHMALVKRTTGKSANRSWYACIHHV